VGDGSGTDLNGLARSKRRVHRISPTTTLYVRCNVGTLPLGASTPPHEQAPRGVLRALTCHILPKWYKNKKGYLRKGGDGWNDGLR